MGDNNESMGNYKEGQRIRDENEERKTVETTARARSKWVD